MSGDDCTPQDQARYAYDGLDRTIHERARLGLLTSLATHPKGLAFSDLRRLCNLTDGNLSRHLQILKDEGLVEIEKSFVANRPQTSCHITEQGRSRYLGYLDEIERVLRDAAATRGKLIGLRDSKAEG